MSKPFEVGDVVVFNSKYVKHVPAIQNAGRIVGDTVFDADAVMVVKSISAEPDSQSGWHIETALQDNEAAGTMIAWDSDWFDKKGDS